jgi:hypothetical protein
MDLRSRTKIAGERRDTETVMRRSERGGWKSAHRGNSLAAYSTLMHGFGAERRGRPRRLGSDQHRQVVDILLRDKRDRASAEAFFRRALNRTGRPPHTVVSDHHQPYTKAVASIVPRARPSAQGCIGLRERRRNQLNAVTSPRETAYAARTG